MLIQIFACVEEISIENEIFSLDENKFEFHDMENFYADIYFFSLLDTKLISNNIINIKQ